MLSNNAKTDTIIEATELSFKDPKVPQYLRLRVVYLSPPPTHHYSTPMHKPLRSMVLQNHAPPHPYLAVNVVYKWVETPCSRYVYSRKSIRLDAVAFIAFRFHASIVAIWTRHHLETKKWHDAGQEEAKHPCNLFFIIIVITITQQSSGAQAGTGLPSRGHQSLRRHKHRGVQYDSIIRSITVPFFDRALFCFSNCKKKKRYRPFYSLSPTSIPYPPRAPPHPRTPAPREK